MLHLLASRYPIQPTAIEQQEMQQFIYAFARVYGCLSCRHEFALLLQSHPPRVSKREYFINCSVILILIIIWEV